MTFSECNQHPTHTTAPFYSHMIIFIKRSIIRSMRGVPFHASASPRSERRGRTESARSGFDLPRLFRHSELADESSEA